MFIDDDIKMKVSILDSEGKKKKKKEKKKYT